MGWMTGGCGYASFTKWWRAALHPTATNKDIFTHDLQTLADTIGLEIRAVHVPSDGSKYNPIERRIISHILVSGTAFLAQLPDGLVDVVARDLTLVEHFELPSSASNAFAAAHGVIRPRKYNSR